MTTAYTLGEVIEEVPFIAQKTGLEVPEILEALVHLPLRIYTREAYAEQLGDAKSQLKERDISDSDLLALALYLNIPLWSNDKDFDVTTVKRYSTFDLLNRIGRE